MLCATHLGSAPQQRQPQLGRAVCWRGRMAGRVGRVREEPALALGGCDRARPQRDRSAVDDAGVSVLVAVDLHAWRAVHLRADCVRRPYLGQLLDRVSSREEARLRGAMFFGLRKRHDHADGASRPIGSTAQEDESRQPLEWRAWRRAARRVTRAWNGWLAADDGERAERYRRYVVALVEEHAAIELARALNFAVQTTSASGCIDTAAGSPAHDASRA